MFCVLYKFTVKSNLDDPFRQHWLAVTQWYYRNAGSLGSRLHRTNNGEYIGYAQWASREQWSSQRDTVNAELQGYRQAMRQCCESIDVLYELDTTDDYLQSEPFGG